MPADWDANTDGNDVSSCQNRREPTRILKRFDPAGRRRKRLGKAIWRAGGKIYPAAMSLFDLVRLRRQHNVWIVVRLFDRGPRSW